MEEEKKCNCKCKNYHHQANASGGAVYGLGLIGAAIFFISRATTFWLGVLGFGKAIVWPAFLVYHALKMLYK
jgi:hypothetical protein